MDKKKTPVMDLGDVSLELAAEEGVTQDGRLPLHSRRGLAVYNVNASAGIQTNVRVETNKVVTRLMARNPVTGELIELAAGRGDNNQDSVENALRQAHEALQVASSRIKGTSTNGSIYSPPR